MKWIRLAAATALAGMLAGVFSSPAMAEESKAFHYECPRGAYLTGLWGKAGDWIDTIDIECAHWNADRQKLGAPEKWDYNDVGHSGGGGEASALCDRGAVVAGNYTYDYSRWGKQKIEVLHHVVFNCHPVNGSGDIVERRFGSNSRIKHLSERGNRPHQCANGEFATGIKGDDGEFIYAFDFICRAAPVSPVAMTKPAGPDVLRDSRYKAKRVGGSLKKGDSIIVGDAGPANVPPPPGSTPPPPIRMTKTKAPVDVLKEPDGEKYGGDADFLPGEVTFPVLEERPGWCKLKVNVPFVPGGEGWVTATFLEGCGN